MEWEMVVAEVFADSKVISRSQEEAMGLETGLETALVVMQMVVVEGAVDWA